MRCQWLLACVFIVIYAVHQEAQAQGFDCSLARSDAEFTVCGNKSLSSLDMTLNQLYINLKALPGIRDQQKRWIAQRDSCGQNHGCLNIIYKSRVNELRSLLSAPNRDTTEVERPGSGGGRSPAPTESSDCKRFPGLC
ncbi:lysozyme inhibitor LprI family protein [Methylobacterium radiodurans]